MPERPITIEKGYIYQVQSTNYGDSIAVFVWRYRWAILHFSAPLETIGVLMQGSADIHLCMHKSLRIKSIKSHDIYLGKFKLILLLL